MSERALPGHLPPSVPRGILTPMSEHALSPHDLLSAAASLAAADFERFVSDVLALRAQRIAPRLPPAEADLLVRINKDLPAETRARCEVLRGKLEEGTLDEDEQAELIGLSDEIELFGAERIRCLVELAKLRGKKLGALMKELGIEGPPDAAGG